jgi:hypothetical protein
MARKSPRSVDASQVERYVPVRDVSGNEEHPVVTGSKLAGQKLKRLTKAELLNLISDPISVLFATKTDLEPRVGRQSTDDEARAVLVDAY